MIFGINHIRKEKHCDIPIRSIADILEYGNDEIEKILYLIEYEYYDYKYVLSFIRNNLHLTPITMTQKKYIKQYTHPNMTAKPLPMKESAIDQLYEVHMPLWMTHWVWENALLALGFVESKRFTQERVEEYLASKDLPLGWLEHHTINNFIADNNL